MRTKIVIHPDYQYLEAFCQTLPERFNNEGSILYSGRNVLKTFRIENELFVVKSFKKPPLINKIAYTFFRKSKACRSYEHGCELSDRGIPTPQPAAYLETYTNGLISRSFYICIYQADSTDIRSYADSSHPDYRPVMREVAHFIYQLHQADVLHIDLSPGNILRDGRKGLKQPYMLVDINRMHFKKISEEEALHNFERLCLSIEASSILAEEYALCRGWNTQKTIQAINRYADLFFGKRAIESAIKKRRKEKGISQYLFGPVQQYLLLRCLRLFLLRGSKDNQLYIKEKELYNSYIQVADIRQVLNRKYGYTS